MDPAKTTQGLRVRLDGRSRHAGQFFITKTTGAPGIDIFWTVVLYTTTASPPLPPGARSLISTANTWRRFAPSPSFLLFDDATVLKLRGMVNGWLLPPTTVIVRTVGRQTIHMDNASCSYRMHTRNSGSAQSSGRRVLLMTCTTSNGFHDV